MKSPVFSHAAKRLQRVGGKLWISQLPLRHQLVSFNAQTEFLADHRVVLVELQRGLEILLRFMEDPHLQERVPSLGKDEESQEPGNRTGLFVLLKGEKLLLGLFKPFKRSGHIPRLSERGDQLQRYARTSGRYRAQSLQRIAEKMAALAETRPLKGNFAKPLKREPLEHIRLDFFGL